MSRDQSWHKKIFLKKKQEKKPSTPYLHFRLKSCKQIEKNLKFRTYFSQIGLMLDKKTMKKNFA